MSSSSLVSQSLRDSVISQQERRLSELLVRGNIVPIDTPCDSTGVPVTSRAELQRVVQQHVKLGNTHLFVLGETGEFRFMKNDQRQEFAAAFVPLAVKAGLNVFLNVTAENKKNTLANIAEFGKLPGVGAYILAPLWGEGNYSLLQDLSKRRDKCGRPFALYNNPGFTNGKNIPESALWVARGGYIAFKDSSGDPTQSLRYIKEIALIRSMGTSGLRFYLGSEKLASRFIDPLQDEHAGAAWGLVGSSDNIGSHVKRLAAEENPEKRAQRQSTLDRFFNELYDDGRCTVAAQKYYLYRKGVFDSPAICDGNSAALTLRAKTAIDTLFI